MGLWEDPRVQLPQVLAVGLVRLAGGVAERVVEVAVSSGLAVVAVSAGHLMSDACRDLGECEPDHTPHARAAA